MGILSLQDLDLSCKKVVMRVDFNVPIAEDGTILDPTRIEAVLPSIRTILGKGASLVLISHLGRPKGVKDTALSLLPCVAVLEALLQQKVTFVSECIGAQVKKRVDALQAKEVLLLENLRFYRAEEHPEEDPSFAKELASFGDVFVNDAFGTAHRKHSSTYSLPIFFPGCAAAGLLMEKEIHYLGELLTKPERPFVALIGGAKISTKIGILKTLIHKVDSLCIGGAMAFTFLKAQGHNVGTSKVEASLITAAQEILEIAQSQSTPLLLPTDFLCARALGEHERVVYRTLKEGLEEDEIGLDIGEKSIKIFSKEIEKSKTILWNGPMGVYELDSFAKGTLTLAKTLSHAPGTTIVGGGDLVAAVQAAGISDRLTHVSTGGGASLEFIEHGTLPALEVLTRKNK